MTRYKRRATRNETMRDLIAEVRALRAEIAMLADRQVQVVPMPYPQPYPVYPVVPATPPYNPYQWPQRYYTLTNDFTTINGRDLTSGSGGPTTLTYNVGD